VFAVPRSIAKSLENKLNKDLNAIFDKYPFLNFQIFKLILSDKEMPFREKPLCFCREDRPRQTQPSSLQRLYLIMLFRTRFLQSFFAIFILSFYLNKNGDPKTAK